MRRLLALATAVAVVPPLWVAWRIRRDITRYPDLDRPARTRQCVECGSLALIANGDRLCWDCDIWGAER